jgi:hypothetical protein
MSEVVRRKGRTIRATASDLHLSCACGEHGWTDQGTHYECRGCGGCPQWSGWPCTIVDAHTDGVRGKHGKGCPYA